MPNYIKTSGSTSLRIATRNTNFKIGVNGSDEYGPSNVTGFYAGVTPPVGGYTIYVHRVSGGPAIHVANNDNECIFLLNSFGATGSTISDVLTWVNGQTDIWVQSEDLVSNDLDSYVKSFTDVGEFIWTAPLDVTLVEYLVVGGGGGGGNGYDTGGGAGGGGGMVRTGTLSVTPGQTYTVVVGNGGIGGADTRSNSNGTNGEDSIFSSITSLGGGLGRGSRSAPTSVGYRGSAQSGTTTAPTGGDGGGNGGTAVGGSGGGGGGAGGNGTNGINGSGGTGGVGISSTITGPSVTYGRGGNGARGNFNTTEGANGASNTGNGGGGGGAASANSGGGGNGGSGVVILKY